MAGKTRRELIRARLLPAMAAVAMSGTATLAFAQTAAPFAIQSVQATADQVTLQGTGKIQAAAFILGDPIRLRVDISAAVLNPLVPTTIPVNGDPIQSVTATSLQVKDKSVVRLELALTRDANYQLQPGENSLTISLTPRQFETEKVIPQDMYQQALSVEEQLYAKGSYIPPPSDIKIPPSAYTSRAGVLVLPTTAPSSQPGQPQPEYARPPSRPAVTSLPPLRGNATQVVDVLHRGSGRKAQILIKTNGMVGKFDPFTLDQPNRLVIDLPGLKEASVRDRFSIAHSGILRVRLGAHPDKTRAVIDFSGPIPLYSFSRVKQGLVVTLSLP